QIIGVPSVLCHRMSDLLSLLKSPEPTMCHAMEGLGSVAEEATVLPLMKSISGTPEFASPSIWLRPLMTGAVAVSWKMMSETWSPLKSFFTRVEIDSVVVVVKVLLEPAPSLTVQLSVRVGFAPELDGSAPDEKVTLSSTCW